MMGQPDLQAEVLKDFVPEHLEYGGKDYRVEGNQTFGYIGVDSCYQTYASETEKPGNTDYELLANTTVFDHLIDNADDDGNIIDAEVVDEEDVADDTAAPVVVNPVPEVVVAETTLLPPPSA